MMMMPHQRIGGLEREMEMADHHHHESNTSPHEMSMMKMYFHFGLNDQVLFPRLILDSNLKLCLTCLVLFITAIFCEFLKYLRGLRCRCELVKPFHLKLINGHDHEQGGNGRNGNVHCKLGLLGQNRSYRLAQSLLQAICTFLSLALMLVAMTYNICLIFAIVLGKFSNQL